MEINLSLRLCFFLLLGIVNCAEAGKCNKDEVVRCLGPLSLLMSPNPELELKRIRTEAAVQQLCSMVSTSVQCASRLRAECQLETNHEVIVQTVADVGGYICTDFGRAALISEKDCWNNPAFEEGIRACDELAHAAGPDYEYCSLVSDILSCGKTSTEKVCGPRAAMLVAKISYYNFQPIASHMMGCQLRLRFARTLSSWLPMIH